LLQSTKTTGKRCINVIAIEAPYITTKARLSKGQDVVVHVGNDSSDSDSSSDITSQYVFPKVTMFNPMINLCTVIPHQLKNAIVEKTEAI
jgi:hypothetical protein